MEVCERKKSKGILLSGLPRPSCYEVLVVLWSNAMRHKRIYTDKTEVPQRVKVCLICAQWNNINNYIHTIFTPFLLKIDLLMDSIFCPIFRDNIWDFYMFLVWKHWSMTNQIILLKTLILTKLIDHYIIWTW